MDERQLNALMARLAEMLQGIRQYVGARYVPNFIDDPWNDTTEYEALDVVDNGMGTSYIAKKPVPVGTPLSNRNYWFVYGSTSGAIINLQNQIDEIVNTTQDLTESISYLDTFGDLKNKTIAVFGASNELASYTGGVNWVDELATILDGYSVVVNKSVAGRGIIQAISDYIADVDKDSYDIVIFCCTKNQYINQNVGDLGYGSMESGNIATSINSLASYKALNQQFFFASCTPYSDDFKAMPMSCYDAVVKKLVEKNGYSMLDMHSWLGCSDENSNQYTSDNIHYLATVAPIFAKRAIKALIKGSEPFTNYSCRISGADINSYAGFTFATGLEIFTGNPQFNSFLECDVNGKVYGQMYIINNSSAIIPSGTDLISCSDATPSPFMNVWFCVRNLTSLKPLDTSSFNYTNRTRNIRSGNDIGIGEYVLITWGDLDSWTQAPA